MTGLRVLAATALAKFDRWVVARREVVKGRLTKVPYRATAPTRNASSTDPSTWSAFEAARLAVEIISDLCIGFVLGDGFVGVDLDKCRDPRTGAIEEWALDVIKLLDSYSEISISETGVHIICRGTLPPGGRRKGPIEMYDRARFFVMTGNPLHAVEIVDRTAALAELHAIVFGPPKPAAFDPGLAHGDVRGTENIDDDDVYGPLSDDDVLLRAASSKNGEKFLSLWRGELSDYGGDHSSADLALVSILLFWTRGDRVQADRLFRESDLVRPKWTDREDYRDRTFQKAAAL